MQCANVLMHIIAHKKDHVAMPHDAHIPLFLRTEKRQSNIEPETCCPHPTYFDVAENIVQSPSYLSFPNGSGMAPIVIRQNHASFITQGSPFAAWLAYVFNKNSSTAILIPRPFRFLYQSLVWIGPQPVPSICFYQPLNIVVEQTPLESYMLLLSAHLSSLLSIPDIFWGHPSSWYINVNISIKMALTISNRQGSVNWAQLANTNVSALVSIFTRKAAVDIDGEMSTVRLDLRGRFLYLILGLWRYALMALERPDSKGLLEIKHASLSFFLANIVKRESDAEHWSQSSVRKRATWRNVAKRSWNIQICQLLPRY
ncbi:uncharacterized protein BDR25DRAFT_348437 [Lindgomyces ingoldianus]|uniref:Uncharacterized protein n=1 Tax=Lindgomyces ingoldianus TaxID=673940 RepID=A0ACB6RG32_9PLEO|nr:uncharacterized protein BDR25DRAFT_348437 [Lindgomyces ingoldianus]KAF2478171.1 hypothetical protein BDR25DRAFT_348437 [Lindgomyces ingoldianus]